MTTDREKMLEDALMQFLKPVRGIPFEIVIKSLCGTLVEKFDPRTGDNQKALSAIIHSVRDVCKELKAKPIQRDRPNEVGNDMEPFVIKALTNRHLNAIRPKTKSGRGKSTGYPDIKIETNGMPIYLEIKSYAAANHDTTQRSFYLSPAEDSKVSEDGYHLLVGFEIERTGNSYIPVAFEIVDLYGLDCDMKAEFNSDNKRLYQKNRILAQERL